MRGDPGVGTRIDASDGVVIDLREPATAAFNPATTQTIDRQVHRRVRLAGVTALVALNALDVFTTYRALDAGAQEANPVGAFLIDRGMLPWVKLAVLAVLVLRTTKSEPKLGTTCALWFVVGVYSMVIVINAFTLHAHGAL